MTQAMRQVCEGAQTLDEVIRGKEDLVRYMGWWSAETLRAYEHYFQAERHAKIQDVLYQQLAAAMREASLVEAPVVILEETIEQNGWAILLALGGMREKGGEADAALS